MSRPNFCPECGKPLHSVEPFSVGPKDYADGGYVVICHGADNNSFCWQGDVYPESEKRGGYAEEDKRQRFEAAVEREKGRLDRLMDTMAMYQIECHDRIDAHLKAMTDEEIKAFMVRCDVSQANCHGVESHAMGLKRRAQAVLGGRWHRQRFEELGRHPYCLYHACAMKDCATQHEDD